MAQVNAAPDEENLSMCDHLERRGSRYSIRRKIPKDLIAHYGRTMFTKALGTSDFAEAKKRCRALTVELDREWDAVRAQLAVDSSSSVRVSSAIPEAAPPSEQVWGFTEDEIDQMEFAWQDAIRLDYEYDAREPFRQAIREVIAEDGLAGLAVVAGFDSGTRQADLGLLMPKSGKTLQTRLMAVVDKWAAERKPKARTVQRTRRIVQEFERHTGCSIIEQTTKEHVLKFKDALLAEGDSPGNINVKIPMLGTIFNYAVDNIIITANPASRVRVADKRKANELRLNLDDAQLKAIFSGSVYSKGNRPRASGGEAAYWMPLLGLFTGGRLNELGQLRPEDVYEESYIDVEDVERKAWVIRITADEADDIDVKTDSSIRRVPVHAKLIELGFIEFVATTRGKTRIFHEIELDKEGKITNTWGKWFINQYMRKECGILTDRRLVFHSFRHTFKHLSRLAGIPTDVHNAFTGHKSGDVADNYGGLSYPLMPLIEGMKRYRVPGLVL